MQKGIRGTGQVTIQVKDAIARTVKSVRKKSADIARGCWNAIAAFWSSLQLGHIFRRLGLPFWGGVGLAIAGWMIDNLVKLSELAIRYVLGTTPTPTPKEFLVHTLMIGLGLGFTLFISLGYKFRRPLMQGVFVSDKLTQPDGKKGLILLVSNPNSAMFAIEYHYITKRCL
ncbi:hypothetical protein [Phormidium sp. CCY1219]|uniref:hypothetical protein n=1 Tax=Phormidium sp. CCY1219 TaxID=2886104 RepID=UPI002D787A55|nr:hypothetical protein [Phormidium sp. CCY1219]